MAINTNIYGTSDNWNYPATIDGAYRNYYNTNIELLTSFNAAPPKAGDFGGSADNYQGSFERGNTTGKTPINSDIDNTIIAFGQHQNVSPFGRVEVVNITHSEHTPIFNTEYISKSAPINTFYSFFYCPTNESAYTRRHSWFNNKGNYDGYIWSPDATAENNINLKYYPIVSYGVKSMLNVPMVLVYNGEIGGAQNGLWVTLDEWRDTYNTLPCFGIGIYTRIVKTISENSITYTGFNEMFNDARYISSCVYDDIDDFTDYSFLSNTQWGHTPSTILMIYNQWVDSYNKTPDSYRYYYPNMSAFDNCQRVYHFELRTFGGELLRVGYKMLYSANNYNTIMQWCAMFGLPFTPTTKTTFDTTFDDIDLYFPVIDDDGVLHGEYTHGSGNRTNSYNTISDIHDIDYNPTKPVDPNTYSDTTTFNTVDFRQAFTRRYILNATQVAALAGELWDAMATKDPGELTSDFTYDEFLTNNPIDCIVSLKYFPCTFADVAPAVVFLGKYQTNIAATALGTSVRIIDFTPIQVWRHFDDFRDFEPYTQIQLYVPLCGVVDLATAEVMGNYVSVKLAIDIATGAATGYVIVSKTGSGGICIATVQGNAAIDIPVSGLQSANLQQAIFDSISNYMQTSISTGSYTSGLFNSNPSKLGMVGNIAMNKVSVGGVARGTQSPLGAINTALSFVDALNPVKMQQQVASSVLENSAAIYDLQHIQMPTRMIGSASPALSTVMELNCRLIIYHPITDNNALASYADTVGFACMKSGVVGNFSGFTVGTIDVSGINATDDEKQAIAAAFANGVYL